MWERKEDSISEEARKKEVAKEDKHNLKRSPVQNKYNHRHNKEHGIKEDAQTTIVRKIGGTEVIMNHLTQDRMNMERATLQKMSPKKNGKWWNAKTTRKRSRKTE